jgi:hypothetical protein
MLVLAIVGFSAAAGACALIWNKIIIPVDRMHRLSEELYDPGYRVTVPLDPASEPSPEIYTVAFSKDLQRLYAAAQRSAIVSKKALGRH